MPSRRKPKKNIGRKARQRHRDAYPGSGLEKSRSAKKQHGKRRCRQKLTFRCVSQAFNYVWKGGMSSGGTPLNPAQTRVYQCKYCKQYHLTSSSRRHPGSFPVPDNRGRS